MNVLHDTKVTGMIAPAKLGKWEIERFVVKKDDVSCQLGGFFSSGRMVPPGTYTRLMRHGAIIMSDTPDELRDLWPLSRATGRVLVSGLGLGCAVKALLAKEDVKHVTVVEIDPEVVALVGPYFKSPRCEIVPGDAYEFSWPKGMRWNFAWHDIWDELCTDDLAEHTKLRRKYARAVDEQECWGAAFLKGQRNRERRYA